MKFLENLHNGKGHKKQLATLSLTVLLALSGMGMSYAADTDDGNGNGVAIGKESNAPKAENVAIGKGATIKYSNGDSKATGDVAIGNGAIIDNYASQGGSIAIGKNAKVENMAGSQERIFAFGQTKWNQESFLGMYRGPAIPEDPSKAVASIAIGDNTYARTGSVMIGPHNYNGDLGDKTVNMAEKHKLGVDVFATTIGANSYTNGAFATNTGAYNIISGSYSGGNKDSSKASQNFGATITGSLNSIESSKAGNFSGIANSIVGVANRTNNSNGSLIFGAGNVITNSITELDGTQEVADSAKEFQQNLIDSVKKAESGGAALAIGGSNTIDYAQKSQVMGVGNTLKGENRNVSKFNFIDGYKNSAEKVNNAYIIGANNEVKNGNNNIVFGDNHKIDSNSNNVVIGSSDNLQTVDASDSVQVGHNAQAKGVRSVAVGFNVQAKGIDATAVGSSNNAYTDNSVAIGKSANAGTEGSTEDTDAIAIGSTVNASKKGSIAIGHNASATVAGGAAIGENSVASTAAGEIGYDLRKDGQSSETSAIWKATNAAVSVGNGSTLTRQITGVAAGTEDTDAVNVAQLKKAKYTAGDNVTIDANNKISATDTTIKASKNALSYDKTNGTLSMTVEDTKGNKATGSVQISDIKAAVDTNTTYNMTSTTTGESGVSTQSTTVTVTGSDKTTSTVTVNNDTLVKGDYGLSLNGNTLSMSVKDTANNVVTGSVDLSSLEGLGKTYSLEGTDNGNNTTTLTLKDNDGTESGSVTVATKDTRNTLKAGDHIFLAGNPQTDGSKEYTVSVEADGKVASGDTGLVTGNTVAKETRTASDGFVTKTSSTAGENILALDKQVEANTNSINNINQTVNNMGGQINKLGTRINKVGAGAAALAALHPQDFDPDDKWDVAAGYGNYKDANAAAVGAFYHPNEDTMISVGGSFGGGENMVNAGVSVKLGQGNHVTTSRVAMAREILDMKQKMEKLEAQNQYLMKRLGAAPEGALKDVNFPDVPKDHWAYQYVKTLADKGYIEGYPDGEFKGDRAMTRYEYAAVIYRALQNGAPVDDKMAKVLDEFEPELDHIQKAARFRVDRISGKDEDRGKVERVRVNNDQEERDVYGGKIPAALKK